VERQAAALLSEKRPYSVFERSGYRFASRKRVKTAIWGVPRDTLRWIGPDRKAVAELEIEPSGGELREKGMVGRTFRPDGSGSQLSLAYAIVASSGQDTGFHETFSPRIALFRRGVAQLT
jgi:hypothetical protein